MSHGHNGLKRIPTSRGTRPIQPPHVTYERGTKIACGYRYRRAPDVVLFRFLHTLDCYLVVLRSQDWAKRCDTPTTQSKRFASIQLIGLAKPSTCHDSLACGGAARLQAYPGLPRPTTPPSCCS
jgi:hypothetical protein